MEGIALVLGCDVMKGTVARAPVYGQDSSRLLSTGLLFFQCETLKCMCVRMCVCLRACVCVFMGIFLQLKGIPTYLPHPLMSLQVLLGGSRKWVRVTTVKSTVDGHTHTHIY